MNRYPMAALVSYLVAIFGGIMLVGGVIYALNLPGRNIAGLRFGVAVSFALGAALLWLIAGVAQAVLNMAEAVQAEHQALTMLRKEAADAAYQASRRP